MKELIAAANLLVQDASEKIPVSVFSTDRINAKERFEAWRESIGVIFDVEARDKQPQPGFSPSVRSYNLGEILVGATQFGPERFVRNRHRIACDGIDHYLIQLYDQGSLIGSTRRHQMKVRPGDIQIVDLGQAHESVVQSSSTIVIAVARDLMAGLLPPQADVHGLVLPGDHGAGGLLADYMRALRSRMETLTAVEAPFVASGTVHMISACLYPSADSTVRARPEIDAVITERFKRYIAENMGSRELSPDALCRRFNISRTQLYRMFEPVGGVMNYIQARRLESAFARLHDPLYSHRRVSEIAYGLGFSSMAHFSGAFRRQFGLSPSEIRAAVPRSAEVKSMARRQIREAEGYEDWLRRLGHQHSGPPSL